MQYCCSDGIKNVMALRCKGMIFGKKSLAGP
jgi:hypothetical protein